MTERGYIGQKGLNRKLRKMGPKITEVVKPVMKNIAEEVRFEALSNVPVGETGDLARALHVQIDSRGLSARVGYWSKGNKRRWELAGWRAHFVEFGTVTKPAQPFLTPAFNAVRRNAAKDIDKAVDTALKEVARGN